jgi:poly-beta-1,6-N-acetyl-D-glucosamine biosynthesis protein PgaD
MKEYPEILESSSQKLPFILVLRDIILTALCWLLFIYFLRGAFQFFGDVWDYISNGFQGAEHYTSFAIVDTIILYGEIILITNAVYALWAIYNKLRFGNKKRRRNAPVVTPDEVAGRFKFNPRDVEGWQKAQTLVIHHDKGGRIINIVKV